MRLNNQSANGKDTIWVSGTSIMVSISTTTEKLKSLVTGFNTLSTI